MSYTDVGKDAKRKGTMHPKHARKTDPEPPRATPKAKPHRKAKKPWGYTYETYWAFFGDRGWDKREKWFDRKASRDQSLARWRAHVRQYDFIHFRNVNIVDPVPPDNSSDAQA